MEPAVISTEVEKSRVQGSVKEISPFRSQAPSSRDDRRSCHCGRRLPPVEMTGWFVILVRAPPVALTEFRVIAEPSCIIKGLLHAYKGRCDQSGALRLMLTR